MTESELLENVAVAIHTVESGNGPLEQCTLDYRTMMRGFADKLIPLLAAMGWAKPGELDTLRAELAESVGLRQYAESQWKAATEERDRFRAECERFVRERAPALSERDKLRAELQEAHDQAERDRLRAELAEALKAADDYRAECGKLRTELDQARAELDQANSERDKIATYLDDMTRSRKFMYDQLLVVSHHRDLFRAERDKAEEKAAELRKIAEEIEAERDRLRAELANAKPMSLLSLADAMKDERIEELAKTVWNTLATNTDARRWDDVSHDDRIAEIRAIRIVLSRIAAEQINPTTTATTTPAPDPRWAALRDWLVISSPRSAEDQKNTLIAAIDAAGKETR